MKLNFTLFILLSALLFQKSSAQTPVADFSASDTIICADDCIQLTDQSTNATAWKWIFAGGTPAVSTVQNPMVCYLNKGNYNVTLIVYNGVNTDTLTRINHITVHAMPVVSVITHSFDTLFCSVDTGYVAYQWYDS